VAGHLNNLAALVTAAMKGVSSLVSRLPCSNVDIDRWGVAECAIWYGAIAAIWCFAGRISRRRLF
jgi:hypothetical protein